MDTKTNELFWNASLEEVKNGFIEEEEDYRCIICEDAFEKGRIYEINSELYDAKRAVQLHIEEKHGSMLEYLLK